MYIYVCNTQKICIRWFTYKIDNTCKKIMNSRTVKLFRSKIVMLDIAMHIASYIHSYIATEN